MKTKLLFLILLLSSVVAFADECRPVKFNNTELFCFKQGVGSYTPQERSEVVEKRLLTIAQDWIANSSKIHPIEREESIDIVYNDMIIVSLKEGDIDLDENQTLYERAQDLSISFQLAIDSSLVSRAPHELATSSLYALGTILGLIIILYLFSIIFPAIHHFFEKRRGSLIRSIRIQSFEIISDQKVLQIIQTILTITRVALSLILTYFFISLTLSFFPETADLAPKLLSHVINPFFMMGEFIVDFIPKLFFIAVILLVTRYALKFIHFVFDQVAMENIKFKDFHPEWADPTYKLVRILIIALCFVVVFPYLPGSDSPAFKGVTVFLGVLFSLGSSPAIGNIVAGIIITYMRPFKVGDRVRISDTEGDIIEKNLLVTRIRTERNEDITIPNSMVLGSHITNYNTSARDGLALYAVVTLGYEVPWQEAHALMIKAAEKTKGVVSKPSPYVLHKFLHDFYVIYEIYAYTDNPNLKYLTHSELNKNIQDVFNEAGIELVSPHLAGLRDSNHTSIHSGMTEKFERNKSFILNSENKKS